MRSMIVFTIALAAVIASSASATQPADRGTPAPERAVAPAPAQQRSIGGPAITFTREGRVTRIGVEGLPFDQVRAVRWGEDDVTDALRGAVDAGWATLTATPTGFELTVDEPAMLGLSGEGLFTLELATGTAVSAYAPAAALSTATTTACRVLTFSAPSRNPVTAGCGYGGTACGKPGHYHTGIDYGYSATAPDAVAVANGAVVRVEQMSSADHGMGTNVIVLHILPDCSAVYSTYSHLASVDSQIAVNKAVLRGQRIGTIGGSGYGKTSYWPRHLHFEMKRRAVTGTPWSYAGTCTSGCWGYTPYHPNNYGYNNPRTWY